MEIRASKTWTMLAGNWNMWNLLFEGTGRKKQTPYVVQGLGVLCVRESKLGGSLSYIQETLFQGSVSVRSDEPFGTSKNCTVWRRACASNVHPLYLQVWGPWGTPLLWRGSAVYWSSPRLLEIVCIDGWVWSMVDVGCSMSQRIFDIETSPALRFKPKSNMPVSYGELPPTIWVCLKIGNTPKPNGFADHYPY